MFGILQFVARSSSGSKFTRILVVLDYLVIYWNIEPILKYIQKQQIKWSVHLERMPCDSIPYKAYIKRGKEDRRARGRTRVRWIDNIRETLQEHQMTITEAAKKQKQEACISLDTQKGIKGSKDR
jgi:hypothetical protein